MSYRENPKTKGSGIVCCIPQTGTCPNGCADCFFQSGRSYLEPLSENLPNMPEDVGNRVVRVNDGNDSNCGREEVVAATLRYPSRFYNTAVPLDLGGFGAPVVLILNPGARTDDSFFKVDRPPKNLMFVRFRTNTWNLDMADEAVRFYSEREVPVVLTFMAYYDEGIPAEERCNYVFRKRTLNEYWAITTEAWDRVMARYRHARWVYSCGKVEGELGVSGCRFCGNCLREYFAATERMRMG